MYNFTTHKKSCFLFKCLLFSLHCKPVSLPEGLFVRAHQAKVPMEVTNNVSVNSFPFKE